MVAKLAFSDSASTKCRRAKTYLQCVVIKNDTQIIFLLDRNPSQRSIVAFIF